MFQIIVVIADDQSLTVYLCFLVLSLSPCLFCFDAVVVAATTPAAAFPYFFWRVTYHIIINTCVTLSSVAQCFTQSPHLAPIDLEKQYATHSFRIQLPTLA